MDKNFLVGITNNLYRLTLLFPKKEPLRYKMREIADEVLAKYLSLLDLANGYNQSPVLGEKFFFLKSMSNLYHCLDYTEFSFFQLIMNDLEILDGFFEIAKNQNWVSAVELLRLQEEYNRIKAEVKKIIKYLQSKEKNSSESIGMKSQQTQEVKIIPGLRNEENLKNNQLQPVTQIKPRQTLNFRQEKILAILREKEKLQVWQVKEIFPGVSKRTLRRDFGSLLKQGIIERIGERNETFYRLSEKEKD